MTVSAPPSGQSVPQTERGSRTRERLITAAREVFEKHGYLDTRAGHISRRAEVAYGSFYTYFASKEAVFLEVADRLFQDMTTNELVPSPGPDPAARIRHANRAYYEAYRRNSAMMAIIEQVATFNHEFQQMRQRHRAESVQRSVHAIERWQQAGLVPDGIDAEMTARALAAMVDHSLYLWLIQGDTPTATDRLLDALDAASIRALGLAA